MILRLLLVGFSVLLAACSVNPLSGNNSGRSIGEGNIETQVTLLPVQAIQVTYGATKSLDLGGLVEHNSFLGSSLFVEAWLKYALINEEQGHGLSLISGAFNSSGYVDSYGFYVGSIYSYRSKYFEPYTKFKVNQVYCDVTSLGEERERRKKESKLIDNFIYEAILNDVENTGTKFLTYGLGTRLNVSDRSSIGLGVLGVASKDRHAYVMPEFNFTIQF